MTDYPTIDQALADDATYQASVQALAAYDGPAGPERDRLAAAVADARAAVANRVALALIEQERHLLCQLILAARQAADVEDKLEALQAHILAEFPTDGSDHAAAVIAKAIDPHQVARLPELASRRLEHRIALLVEQGLIDRAFAGLPEPEPQQEPDATTAAKRQRLAKTQPNAV